VGEDWAAVTEGGAGLADLARAILRRLRDPEAGFELQALVRGEAQAIWLARRGASLTLQVIGPGGGEVPWEESAFAGADPGRAFEELAGRIDLVVLYAGGPLPDELIGVFQPDESGPVVRYRAEWGSWEEFRDWLTLGAAPSDPGRPPQGGRRLT
jgi:hypothetical protein